MIPSTFFSVITPGKDTQPIEYQMFIKNPHFHRPPAFLGKIGNSFTVGPESRVFLWHKFYSLCGSIFIFIIQIMKVLETSEGLAISYRDSEKGEGPVIFIHGFPFDKSSWEPQFRFLKDKYRVITYDLPGFGWSSPLSGQPDIPAFAHHLIRFMDELGIGKAVVCGLSMGGYILLAAASLYPERLQALILSDTQCVADTAEAKKKRYTTIADIEKNGMEGFTSRFVPTLFSEATQQHQPDVVEQIRQTVLSAEPDSVIAALRAMAEREERCSGLGAIHQPVLVLCGEKDTLTPVSQSEFLSRHIPEAQLQIIGNAAHLPNLENSEAFNHHVENFLTRVL